MEYTFKQIPKQHQKKIFSAIIITSLAAISLVFITLYISNNLKYSANTSIILSITSFAFPTVLSIYWFNKKYSILKTIKLNDNYISVKEESTKNTKEVTEILDSQQTRNYKVTPEMIKSFRYISGSDDANYFHIMTHEKEYEIIIPESGKKSSDFHHVKDQLELWLTNHNIKKW